MNLKRQSTIKYYESMWLERVKPQKLYSSEDINSNFIDS